MTTANWFEETFGFKEYSSPTKTTAMFKCEYLQRKEIYLTSLPNKRVFHVGRFETPTLAQLSMTAETEKATWRSERAHQYPLSPVKQFNDYGLSFTHEIGDVRTYYTPSKCTTTPLSDSLIHSTTLFQIASQFNCLEMASPDVTPSSGISQYFHDKTQGPISSLMCPGAIVYRNYLEERDVKGQCRTQLDCLDAMASVLDNAKNKYFKMQNGYCAPIGDGVARLSKRITQTQEIAQTSDDDKNKEKEKKIITDAYYALKVGIHWNTQVYAHPNIHVAQLFCSALPLAYYEEVSKDDWEPFARLILDSLYEATLTCAVILAYERRERIKVVLTCVGGGVFGNKHEWICAAITKSLNKFRSEPIDVILLHYTSKPKEYKPLHSIQKSKNEPTKLTNA